MVDAAPDLSFSFLDVSLNLAVRAPGNARCVDDVDAATCLGLFLCDVSPACDTFAPVLVAALAEEDADDAVAVPNLSLSLFDTSLALAARAPGEAPEEDVVVDADDASAPCLSLSLCDMSLSRAAIAPGLVAALAEEDADDAGVVPNFSLSLLDISDEVASYAPGIFDAAPSSPEGAFDPLLLDFLLLPAPLLDDDGATLFACRRSNAPSNFVRCSAAAGDAS